jgi:hypothetical protein
MQDKLEQAAIAAVRSIGNRGPRTRIPPEVRRAVLAYANAARHAGRAWREIAGVVGVSAAALHNWRSETGESQCRRRRTRRLLAPVVVRDDTRDQIRTLTLVTCAGHRVEGLDIAGAAELVRRLA